MNRDSVFYIDHILPHRFRHRIIFALNVLSLLLLFMTIVTVGHKPIRDPYVYKSAGLLFIFIALRFVFGHIESFFRSAYFTEPASAFEYERLLYETRRRKVPPIIVFLESDLGKKVLARAGVSAKETHEFARTRHYARGVGADFFQTREETLGSYVHALYEKNKDFADFLFSYGIHGGDIEHIAHWYERELDGARRREFWWSVDRLRRFKSVGRNWAYADTWNLDTYSRTISDNPRIYDAERAYYARDEDVGKIEAILAKGDGANAILIGPPGIGKKEILMLLAYKVAMGRVAKILQYKRVVLCNALFLASGQKSKADFENLLLSVLGDAHNAGNIILAIDDFGEFIASAEALGADPGALLEKFLLSPRMHVIALADPASFAASVEGKAGLMTRFEKIFIEEPSHDNTLLILEERVEEIEARMGILVSYLAIKEVLDGAKRYYTDTTMPAGALGLLDEVVTAARVAGVTLLTKKNVLALLKEKTAIPMGDIEKEEKEKLLNLEKHLHERVIGQDEAINRISDALRRARTDIQNTERPIGSFLFLGPTGVGKTETAKTLARVFFGGEEHMLRLDMSEYQGDDGVKKLVGSFEEGTPGVLSTMIRSHPYGVLLLDEFEKSSHAVHDLFLQVFDEGYFSDMRGRKVNARNIIFVVTSNAASDLIFEAVQRGVDLRNMKDAVIDVLVRQAIFRPEFLNRFDAVVLFHPLGKEHLESVARIMLGELAKRLDEKGIKLVINDVVLRAAIKYGSDPRFGAREMNRAIKEKIENVIAEKIIKGEVKEGGSLELSENDIG